MSTGSSARTFLVFLLAFSLLVLQSTTSGNHISISVLPVRASPAPIERWYPSGPAMDYMRTVMFSDEITELTDFEATNSPVDLTDVPLYAYQVPSFDNSPQNFLARPKEGIVSGIDLNLANDFWGINMTFGTPASGIEIRQGIAHLIDKQSFATSETAIAGYAVAVDNPSGENLPTPNPCGWDTLFPVPNSSQACTVGPTSNNPPGGVAYNCNQGAPCPTGTIISGTNFPWQPARGSPNFCAAAAHFQTAFNSITNGGFKLNQNCILLPPGSKTPDTTGTVWQRQVFFWTVVGFFIRNDNLALSELGQSLAQEICALFTGSFSTGCSPFLSVSYGGHNDFSGFVSTTATGPNLSWWIYTSGAANVDVYDVVSGSGAEAHPSSLSYDSNVGWSVDPAGGSDALQDLYSSYSSAFAQPNTFDHAFCASNIPTYTPSNYGYVCNPAYDQVAAAMASSPCFSASGDPVPGQTTPTFAKCPGTSLDTAVSAGYKAEDIFGKGEYAIPVYVSNPPYAYLNNWQRVVDSQLGGIFNQFAWLNAYSPNPESATEPTPTLTLRQGFSQSPFYLNPYAAHSPWDLAILGSIYDSLEVNNPASRGQSIEWTLSNPNGPIIIQCTIASNGTSTCPGAANPATNPIPKNTTNVVRMDLRSDLFWQDANNHASSGFVSAWDVKFTYATMLANGAFLSAPIASMQCTQPNCVDGIQVNTPRELEIRLKQPVGVAILSLVASIPIIPGRLWSSTCSLLIWDNDIGGSNVPDSCMVADSKKSVPTFDPLKNGILIGSGPWQCPNINGFTPDGFKSPPAIGTGCAHDGSGTPFNAQNPPQGGTIILQRFGYGTGPPGAAASNRVYFRSSGSTAEWIWSGNTGDPLHDSNNKGIVQRCQSAPLAPFDGIPNASLGYPNGCAHWQQGIGAPGGHSLVGSFQIGTVQLYFQVKWTPTTNGVGSDWTSTYGTPPGGIASFPPVLYEGSFVQAGVTYNNVLTPATIATAHCTSAYNATTPVAGYDC